MLPNDTTKEASVVMAWDDSNERLQEILSRRIMVLDGSMGALIYTYKLEEEDVRGLLPAQVTNEGERAHSGHDDLLPSASRARVVPTAAPPARGEASAGGRGKHLRVEGQSFSAAEGADGYWRLTVRQLILRVQLE